MPIPIDVRIGKGEGLYIRVGRHFARFGREQPSPPPPAKPQPRFLGGQFGDLSVEELQAAAAARTAGISLPDLATEEHRARAAELLDREGIVVVPRFVSGDLTDPIADRIRSILETYGDNIRSGKDAEDDLVFINAEGERLRTYPELAGYPKAVFNLRRGGTDQGFIDIFNFDLCMPEEGRRLRELLSSDLITGIARQSSGRTYEPGNLNIYVTNGVQNTRGFHVDSYGMITIKVFLYLTDVFRIETGPYCYILRSHKEDWLHDLNKDLNSALGYRFNESPVVDPQTVTPILAPRGSLIMSHQTGQHRGIPQAPGEQRFAAVMMLSLKD